MAKLTKQGLIVFGLFLALTISSCKKDEGCDAEANLSNIDDTQLQSDIEAIDAYLAENNINAETHPSGLRYVINSPGKGSFPNLCSRVAVTYDGHLLSNGKRFDETGTPIEFNLNGLILGWQLGIPLIKPTGSITLYIPSVYGYGSRGSGNEIPPNSNLIFNITLVSFN